MAGSGREGGRRRGRLGIEGTSGGIQVEEVDSHGDQLSRGWKRINAC